MATSDAACARCRERKIRCGREKNECANCERDGVECDYSTPGKRINHIKLLCSDVSQIQNQLSIIEDGMATLLSMAKPGQHSNSHPHLQAFPESVPVRAVSCTVMDPQRMEEEKSREVESLDGLTAPNHHYHNDRYYGPGTLLALSHRFRRTLLESTGDAVNHPIQEGLEQHLNFLCSEAGSEESLSGARPAQLTAMQLPPKQLFMVVQSQFFQHCHYATDIFVPSRFRMKVEQLYARPLMAGDEAWTICLHTLTLLVLGPGARLMSQELCTGPSGLLAVHAAVTDPGILVAPQLINVQTLTLLGRLAQQYYPLHLAETIHALVCVLAKTMGLHQLTSREQVNLSAEEVQERVQVFRCLYIQDIGFGLARGSTCWLHTLDCVPLCNLTQGANGDPRIQLAQIQENFLRALHEKNPSRSQLQQFISQNLECLDQWALDHRIFTPAVLGDFTSVDLRQGFFATRIAVLSHHSSWTYLADATVDARVACGMLLLVCAACTPCKAEKLAPTDAYPVVGLESNHESVTIYSQMGLTKIADLPFLPTQSLVEQFPIAAFFLLATGLVTTHALSRDTDLELLQRVSTFYSDSGARRPANNHIHKLGRVFRLVLDAVRHLRPSDVPSESLISDSSQSSSQSNIASTQTQTTPDTSAYTWNSNPRYGAPDGILPRQLRMPSQVGADATVDVTMTATASPSHLPSIRDLQPGGTVAVHDALQQLAWMQVPDALRENFWWQQNSCDPGQYYHDLHRDPRARILHPQQVDPAPDMDLDFCVP
ncbi:hypothetical protein N7467_006066 [Penicillium canescens]|nr:hypothetical protein N7467_006066 [Penicillium canescens]